MHKGWVDTDWNCKNKCKNKRVGALRGWWLMIGIAKRVQKISFYALRGGWPMIGIVPKSAKIRGFMH